MAAGVRGSERYAERAGELAASMESLSFADVHAPVLDLVPTAPCRTLDVGAGSRRDAAAHAAIGHRVTAVEPTRELREIGRRLHQNTPIEWVDDHLPDLAALVVREAGPFGLVLLSAGWMHLDAGERARGLRRLAGLLAPGGTLLLSLRHGPVPEGRNMSSVSAAETANLSAVVGLRELRRAPSADRLGRPDVSWTHLAFRRPSAAP